MGLNSKWRMAQIHDMFCAFFLFASLLLRFPFLYFWDGALLTFDHLLMAIVPPLLANEYGPGLE